MSGYKTKGVLLQLTITLLLVSGVAYSQAKYKIIPLPPTLRSINEEFSGMAQLGNRIYVLPQYGSSKETGLDGKFNMYSFRADSISRVIDGKDTTLTSFNTLKVINLDKLPRFIKNTY